MARTKGRTNRPHPSVTLESALLVSQAIVRHNAGRPMNRLLLAEAMGQRPGSSLFRERIASSAKYGLTEGNYSSSTISLTSLGDRATRPRNNEEQIGALREAMREIAVYDELLAHFSNASLPTPAFLKNILEREPYGIDPGWSASAAESFEDDARFVGYLRDIGGSQSIVIEDPIESDSVPQYPVVGEAEQLPLDEEVPDVHERQTSHVSMPEHADLPVPVRMFIAHGKNRKPLDQLKDILDEWKVPYLVAVDEPNAGRPISAKVAETMRECSAGIFIFTADEESNSGEGDVVARANYNVVYELGAASLLYDRRIVILKERDVPFASDFSDLGWIEFEKDDVRSVAMDLLKEMIALDAVRLVSAASG